MAKLTLTLKGKVLQEVDIKNREVFIGRDPDCELQIDNIGISQFHARILYVNKTFMLYDNDSSNGTFINGDKEESVRLMDGDEIQIGKYIIEFSEEGRAPRLEPTQRSKTQQDIRGAIGTLQFSPDEMDKMVQSNIPAEGIYEVEVVGLDSDDDYPAPVATPKISAKKRKKKQASFNSSSNTPESSNIDLVKLYQQNQLFRIVLIIQAVLVVVLLIALFFNMR